MSQWNFGNFSAEVDFTDADFLDNLDRAKKAMDDKLKVVPKVGKRSDIIRAQCECFYSFFDVLFYDGAGAEVFEGKHSLNLCILAAESLSAYEKSESSRIEQNYGKYQVKNHGNRQQRRANQKYQKNQHQKNW